MKTVTLDTRTLAKLQNLDELAEMRDESGRILGYFHPRARSQDGKVAVPCSPYADEEIEKRRQQRTGRPLGDILKDLRKT